MRISVIVDKIRFLKTYAFSYVIRKLKCQYGKINYIYMSSDANIWEPLSKPLKLCGCIDIILSMIEFFRIIIALFIVTTIKLFIVI